MVGYHAGGGGGVMLAGLAVLRSSVVTRLVGGGR